MNEVGIKDQWFGVEVEFTGITREDASRALAGYFGTSARHMGGSYINGSSKTPKARTGRL